MRIEIIVDDSLGERLVHALAGNQHEFHRINRKLDAIRGLETQEGLDLASLAQMVTNETTIDKSIEKLVEGIAAAIDQGAEIPDLTEKLRASSDTLKAAVLANV